MVTSFWLFFWEWMHHWVLFYFMHIRSNKLFSAGHSSFYPHTKTCSDLLKGISLFGERISQRHQPECTVHRFWFDAKSPNQGSVYFAKLTLMNKAGRAEKIQASVIDSSGGGLKEAADCRRCDNRAIISLSIITFSPTSAGSSQTRTSTPVGRRSKRFRWKGGERGSAL